MPDFGSNDLSVINVVNENPQINIDYKSAEEAAIKFDRSGTDLEIHIDVDFGSNTPVNFVLINPVIASTQSFVKVVDIATASADSDWETVDGFSSQSWDKILTPEANKVLPAGAEEKTLAPSAFSYGGLGVFAFPVRVASKLRITLRSELPVPAIYERMHLLLQDETEITTTVKKKKKGLFKSKKSTKVTKETTISTKILKLSYLQTLAVHRGLIDTSTSETESSSGILSSSQSKKIDWISTILAGGLGGLFGFGTKKSVESSFKSTGFKLKDQWLQPYFDHVRYTIGIKELTIAKYRFAESSEIISVPFGSPKEIVKASVTVDDYIPSEFDQGTPWIKYYVKPEGDTQWIEITPINKPTRFDETGEIIPKILNFNLPKPSVVGTEDKYNYTESPIFQMRFKALITRPVGGDNDSITPLLKSYRIMMIPRND